MSSHRALRFGLVLLAAVAATACSAGPSDDAGSGDSGPLDANSTDVVRDGSIDATPPMDVAPIDVVPIDTPSANETGTTCGCGPMEVCGDGFDNNCDGTIDENCPCIPGTTQRCLNGTPHPGAPLCAFGAQTCTGTGEFGSWGPCSGAGAMADASTSAYACRRIVVIGAPGANPSSNFQSWLEARGAIVSRTQTSASDGPLRRELLDTFDVAIIDWLQRDFTLDEANTLRDWVVAGGGLIAMTGHDSGMTADRQVSLLQSIGVTYRLGTAHDGPATFLASPISVIPGSSRVLGPVTFNGGLEVITTSAFTGIGMSVATVPDGVSVGFTGNYQTPDTPERGRVFVFGDEWIEFDSEWSTMPDIEQLWFNAINWVNPTVVGTPDGCE